jgi:hypothetical protein
MRCAESFSLEVDGTTEEERAELRREIHANILDQACSARAPH